MTKVWARAPNRCRHGLSGHPTPHEHKNTQRGRRAGTYRGRRCRQPRGFVSGRCSGLPSRISEPTQVRMPRGQAPALTVIEKEGKKGLQRTDHGGSEGSEGSEGWKGVPGEGIPGRETGVENRRDAPTTSTATTQDTHPTPVNGSIVAERRAPSCKRERARERAGGRV